MRQSSPNIIMSNPSTTRNNNNNYTNNKQSSSSSSKPIPTSNNNNNEQQLLLSTPPLQIGDPRVKVCCRVRPLSPKEAGSQPYAIKLFPHDVTSLTVTGLTSAGKTTQRYSMDRVFSEDTSQADVFDEIAAPLVQAACSGQNAALFAYGQTGSGKTHSMLGLDVWQLFASKKSEMTNQQRQALERSEQRGVIPRAMQLTFQLLKDRQHKISVSYLEIYNEKIFDLLDAGTTPTNTPGGGGGGSSTNNNNNNMNDKGLEIREDKSGQIQVINATIRRVHSLDEVMDALWRGARNRSVGSTDVNEHSSRSHTIFQVIIETRTTSTMKGTKAKLNLVDLAGSEKWRPHQLQEFTEQRLLEMTSINQSLSNLGQCVRGLLQPGRQHIPYRNSKLTRLLQDALGSNAQLGFIVCISPAESSFDETISTLQFADRAKRIVVRENVASNNNNNNNINTNNTTNNTMNDGLSVPPLSLIERLKIRLNQQQQSSTMNNSSDMHHEDSIHDAQSFTQQNEKEHYLQNLPALQSYHEFLRARVVDNLSPLERLTLLEWSVLVQAEDFERTRMKYQRDLERSQQQLERLKSSYQIESKDKDAEIELLKAEVKAAMAEAKSKAHQLTEMKVMMDASSLSRNINTKVPTPVIIVEPPPQQQPSPQIKSIGSSAIPIIVPLGGQSMTSTTTRPTSPNIASVSSSSSKHISSPSTTSQLASQYYHSNNNNNNISNTNTSKQDSSHVVLNKSSGGNENHHRSINIQQQQPHHQRSNSSSTIMSSSNANTMIDSPSLLSSASFRSSRFASPAVLQHKSIQQQQQHPILNITPNMNKSLLVWESFVDPKTMRPYYYCKNTGVTQWNRPEGFVG
jgi:hypothetical protein